EAAKNQCPSCGSFAQPGAIICLNCGYDARTQSQLQTKFGMAKAAKVKGGGGGGLGIALPESGTVIGAIAFVYFLVAVVLPIVDIFQLKLGLIMISFSIVFLMSFVLWIIALIGFMRRIDNLFISILMLILAATIWPISAFVAMIYGAFLSESRALRWFSITNILGFLVCIGLIVYSLVTETPMMNSSG
ncbi:MAG: zinc ribbon domain-containing protein, partial [Phycisphaerales bacterium]|nr:zinc ribbon domain-containing protein [Phycisphaerales bacterium]